MNVRIEVSRGGAHGVSADPEFGAGTEVGAGTELFRGLDLRSPPEDNLELDFSRFLQPEETQRWFFHADHLKRRQLVANRDHARMLIRTVDDDWPWVVLETADETTFAQVAGRPDGMVIEVNSIPGWIQRVARVQETDRMLTVGAPGDESQVWSSELHTAVEAIALCFAWLDRRELPSGYCLHEFVE